MKCKVLICGEDKTQNFSCEGELIFSKEGFSLSYVFEGNKCLLEYNGEILRHQTKGEIPVKIDFVANGKSVCKIGGDGFCGEIPVVTKFLNVTTDAEKLCVAVVYGLNGEEKKMQIIAEPTEV